MKILIPPSEGKNSGGEDKPLGELSLEVQKKLKYIPKDNLEKFYGVKGDNLKKVIEINKNITKSKTTFAIKRYKGVVYQGISYDTLSSKGKKFFDENVLIISGLFGLVKPLDLIPDYKYKMQRGTKLEIEDFCIDLLPQLHHSAVKYSKGIKVDFKIQKNGKIIPAGHSGKLVKGKFIRFLCENEITSKADFFKFKEDDFEFDGEKFIKTLQTK